MKCLCGLFRGECKKIFLFYKGCFRVSEIFELFLTSLFLNVSPAETTMMEEKKKKSRAVLAVMFLLAVSLPGGGVSAGSDCSPSAAETNGAVRLLSAVVDSQKAERSQRQHLEALFNR